MKYFIIPLFFVNIVTVLFGQDKNPKNIDPVFFEFNPYGADEVRSCQKFGTFVKFKINNVNPFKIEGSTSVVKKSIEFEVPAQFSGISASTTNDAEKVEDAANDQEKVMEILVNKKVALTAALVRAKSKKGEIKKQITALNDEIAKLKSEIEILKKIVDEKKLLSSLQTEFIENYNCFIKTLNRLRLYTSIEEYIDSLLQETFIPDPDVLKTSLTLYMKSINNDNDKIDLIINKCRDDLDNLTNCYINAKKSYEELAKQIKSEKVKLTGQLTNKEKDLEIKIDSAFASFELKKKFEKEFNFITAKFDVIHPETKRKEIFNKTSAGVYFYNRVIKSDFSVFTDGQQLDDDIVTITPKLKNRKGEVLKEFNPIKITTHGGVKVDFSSGYLLSFRGDENYTNLYDNSGIIGIQKNSTDNLRHAIGALAHVYKRSCRPVSIGGAVGISLPTDGARIGFYGGISALLLEKHRLVITLGISYIKTKMLNTANLIKNDAQQKLTGKETYLFANTDYKEIRYDDLYRPAFFFGLTYNIFSIKK